MTTPLRPLSTIQGKCSGPCVVVGSGPSSAPWSRVHGHRRFFCIGANWAAIEYGCDLWVAQDREFFEKAGDAVKRRLGIAVYPLAKRLMTDPKLNADYIGWHTTKVLLQDGENELSDSADELHQRSVFAGVVAVQAACLMSFSPVIVVGLDSGRRDYTYAYSHPLHGTKPPHEKRMVQMQDQQEEDLERLAAKYSLVNCSESDFAERREFGPLLDELPASGEAMVKRLGELWKEREK